MFGHDRPIPDHPGQRGTRRWICRICGFVYDESLGDARHGFAPGTTWEQIPDDWHCPVCRVSKSEFDPLLE